MMTRHFNYPVKLSKQKEGGYLVEFVNIPEAITQGETVEDALKEASDCLEEAIANRMSMKLEIPKASTPKKNQYLVPLHVTIAFKTALYVAMHDKKLSNVGLAKRLRCDEKEVRRLLDPHYHSKLPRIEHALTLLGQRLNVSVAQL